MNRLLYVFCVPFLIVCSTAAAALNGSAHQDDLTVPYIYNSVNVITGSYVESNTDLVLNGSTPLTLRRSYQSQIASDPSSPSGWLTSLPSLLVSNSQEHLPSIAPGFQFEYDEDGYLLEVKSLLPDGTTCRWIKVSYHQQNRECFCTLVSDDGTTLCYQYIIDPSSHGDPSAYLLSVKKNGVLLVSYDYKQHPLTHSLLLSKREEPNQRYLMVEYYDQDVCDVDRIPVSVDGGAADSQRGRVKLLKAPVGADAEPVVTHRFFYGKGYTEVRDALDHKIVYRYGDFQRLTAIEYYDEGDALYRIERFGWKFDPSLPSPLMTSRVVEDSQGVVVFGRFYEYDKSNHLIKEVETGNLTGLGKGDSFTTRYDYKGSSRVGKREGDQIQVDYQYDAYQRLVGEHQIIDGFFHIRTFHRYDEQGFVVETIVDNGTGQESDDLRGVQQRRVTKIAYSLQCASYGLPEVVEELFWDLDAQVYKTLSKTINEYCGKGLLVRQQAFDSDGAGVKDTYYTYDPFGRLTLESDRLGDVTSTEYDLNGNITLLTVQKSDGTISRKEMAYDFANRLVRHEEVHEQGQLIASYYHYNHAGVKVADTVDGLGTTSYVYDCFGRLTAIHQPSFLDADDVLVTPVTYYQYDVLDHVTQVTDPNGWTTKAQYNGRGKPTVITYPDGTQETFEYNAAGMLVQEKNRIGVTTVYTRDGLGRCTKATVIEPGNVAHATTTSVYGSFQLQTKIDAAGNRTVYHYDGAGRLVGLMEQSPEQSKHTVYVYDAKGQLMERRHVLPEGDECEIFEYDIDNKPMAVKSLDKDGHCLYRLDLSQQSTPAHQPMTGFCSDSLGREVRFIEKADAQGLVSKTIFDVLGRPAHVIVRNSLGVLLSFIEYRYDAVGNKTREIHERGGEAAPYILAWQYGLGNRLEASIEAFGTNNQRVTAYEYDGLGNLKKLTKADGVQLIYSFDELGRIRDTQSSDKSIHYVYSYDVKGQITAIQDLLTGSKAVREYNSSGKLTKDIQANGLNIEFKYDKRGRRTKTILPDASAIGYRHTGKLLKSVQRIDKEKNVVYAHHYLKGENEWSEDSALIGGLGVLKETYDEEGKKIGIQSKYWSEHITYNPAGAIMGCEVLDSAGSYTTAYGYDDALQVIAEKGMATAEYQYDLLGNPAGSLVDASNQLQETNGIAFQYDPNGNVVCTTDGKTKKTYVYDALNRLTAVFEGRTSKTIYTYDGFNRRLSKTAFSWSAAERKWVEGLCELYFYDGLCEIGATDSGKRIRQLRVLGAGEGAEVGSAVAVELDERVFAPIHDSRGNVAALVGIEERDLVECYRYTAFGEARIYNAHGDEVDESTVGMPWGYSSKRMDPETGWVFFGLRHYDPVIHRWTTPDPLGVSDGPNRYVYAHNNPVMNRDLFGEFSAGEVWRSGLKMLRHGFDMIRDLINVYQEKVGYAHYSKHEIEEYANAIVGSLFLRLTGFYVHSPETGILGKGEVNDKIRITMINGILNIRAEYMQIVGFFSKAHGSVNIHYVFRPSDGWAHDLLKCVLSKAGLVSSQSRLLARTWKQLIRDMGGVGGGGLIIHYAHSIGGTETSNAVRLLTPAERMMIRVITLGSATLIPDSDFQSVVNYVSWGDGVCYFDPIGYVRALLNHDTNIYLVGSSFGIPLIDHFLENDSYSSVVRMLGADFVRAYGSLNP